MGHHLTEQNLQTVTTVQRPASDNAEDGCQNWHSFLTNLIKSSRDENEMRTFVQELIDMKVEPEYFYDKLVTSSKVIPSSSLRGFLKENLPLLRHRLATNELSIEGIRPPPVNVVFSVASPVTPTQIQVRPALDANQVRTDKENVTAVRSKPVVSQRRRVSMNKSPAPRAKGVATVRQPNVNVVVSNSQTPALHPVLPGNQVGAGVNIRQPKQENLPLLRHRLAKNELSMEGIRPPPVNVASPVTPTQIQVRPALDANQVRTDKENVTAVRPKPFVPQRRRVPINKSPAPRAKGVATVRQPNVNVVVSNSQTPALHPVLPNNQVVAGVNIRQPEQQENLPLLRHRLATNELSMEGIRPPPVNVVFSVASSVSPTQIQVRPAMDANQVRIDEENVTAVRPKPFVPQRRRVPMNKSPAPRAKGVATVRQPNVNVVVSNSQTPALHPVLPGNQVGAGVNIRQPEQQETLPLPRASIATHQVTRPQFVNAPFFVSVPMTPTQTQARPGMAASHVRLVKPSVEPMRPGQFVLHPFNLKTPLRGVAPQATRIGTVRQPNVNVVVPNPQPATLRPVLPGNQVRAGVNIRQPMQKTSPLPRNSIATHQVTRPPFVNVAHSVSPPVTPAQTHVRPGRVASHVRLVKPGVEPRRPGLSVLHPPSLVTPLRGVAPQATRIETMRQPNFNVVVSNLKPPALYPGNQNGSNLVYVQIMEPAVPPVVSRPAGEGEEKESFSSAAYANDDDITDVAAMGGVSLSEETQKIFESTEFVGTLIRSCKEDMFCSVDRLQQRMRQIMAKHGLEAPGDDVAACVSHAAEERIRNMLEKLSLLTSHRLDSVKIDQRYEVTNEVKAKLKFLADVDRARHERHQETEREELLRAAKNRSRKEDPELAKLKAKAKEMQRMEMEERQQREANAVALQAIGLRKKPRLEGDSSCGSAQTSPGGSTAGPRDRMLLRQCMRTATLRDLQFVFEQDKDLRKSKLLYKSYLQ